MKRILVVGDSLSDGFLLKRSQAYPALLAAKLGAARLEYEVTNASQSGGTTAGGLERLPGYLDKPIDIFVLELGINDAFLGVPINEIRQNLQKMIDRVKARNPRVRLIIVGMQLPVSSGNGYVTAFGQLFSELAAANHAALVPYLLEGVGGVPESNLADGFHPNTAGHKVLVETVWRILEPVAREVAAASR